MSEFSDADGEVIEPPPAALAPVPNGLKELPPPAPVSIVQAAVAQGVTDPAVLRQMLEMEEKLEERRAQAAYAAAMTAVQRELPAIPKDRENKFNKTKYAGLESVNRAVIPVANRHGFSFSFGQEPTPEPGQMLRVYIDVTHVAGHSRRYYGDFPVDQGGLKGGDNKTAIQAVGSAFSYARRYLLGLVFNLVFTDDDDNDGQPVAGPREAAPPARPSADRLTAAEVDDLCYLIRTTATNPAAFFTWASEHARARVARVEDVPRSFYKRAKYELERKIAKQKAGAEGGGA